MTHELSAQDGSQSDIEIPTPPFQNLRMADMAGFASPHVSLLIVLLGALSLCVYPSLVPNSLRPLANLIHIQSYGVYLAHYLSENVFPGAKPEDSC